MNPKGSFTAREDKTNHTVQQIYIREIWQENRVRVFIFHFQFSLVLVRFQSCLFVIIYLCEHPSLKLKHQGLHLVLVLLNYNKRD